MVSVMKRVVAIAACGISLAACSSMPSWMQFETPSFMKSAPAATTMQFESEPAGAEARTSLGQACRTPCTQTVTASEFTVSFALPGYQPQTVPVRVVASADGSDAEGARLVPNPVFVELQPAGPAPAKKPAPAAKKKPKAAPRAAPTAMAPEPAPAPAPASPWPPAR
jgi:hypothetical protein